jgi:hypothetical protein
MTTRSTRTANTGTEIVKESAENIEAAPATDGQVAATEKDAEKKAPGPNAYVGNIMHLKRETKSTGKAYALVMVRFVNGQEIAQKAVQVFPRTEGFTSQVGDMFGFEAKRLVEAYDNDDKPMKLEDGTPVYRASGVGPELKHFTVRATGKAASVEPTGEIKSNGLRERLAKASPLMAKFLGVKFENS